MDLKNLVLLGTQEFIINTQEDIMTVLKIIEKNRATRNTKMNQTSSRSHCYIDISLYRKDGGNVYINYIKLVDLAGSERLEKA